MRSSCIQVHGSKATMQYQMQHFEKDIAEMKNLNWSGHVIYFKRETIRRTIVHGEYPSEYLIYRVRRLV